MEYPTNRYASFFSGSNHFIMSMLRALFYSRLDRVGEQDIFGLLGDLQGFFNFFLAGGDFLDSRPPMEILESNIHKMLAEPRDFSFEDL